MRQRTGNAAVLFAQIGYSCHPCPANCSFCSFAEDYTQMQAFTMSDEDIVAATKSFTQDCRTMLFEAGFTHLCKGDGTLVDLTPEYIEAHIH